jgi:hypothetical protein
VEASNRAHLGLGAWMRRPARFAISTCSATTPPVQGRAATRGQPPSHTIPFELEQLRLGGHRGRPRDREEYEAFHFQTVFTFSMV